MLRREMTVFFDLSDRVVLVTGGTKGIGKAIGEEFLRAGAQLAVCARTKEDLRLLEEEWKERSSQPLTVCTDATSESSVEECIRSVLERFGRLDVLVNNVGGAIQFGDLFSLTQQDWQKAFELNVQSMVFFSKAAIPFLKKSRFPRIVNISSISGMEPGVFNPHYTTTKASTINFSKYLANFLAPDRILVNCVCPGTIFSDSLTKSVAQIAREKGLSYQQVEEELLSAEKAKIPLGKIGTGEDVSKTVVFLASDGAQWITGSCFHLNGGKMRAIS